MFGLKFDRVYWLFIGGAVLIHSIAIGCTLYALSHYNAAQECNPAMNFIFSHMGAVEALALSSIMIIAMMILVPFILKQNAAIGLKSAICEGVFVMLLGTDALNDIWMLSNNPLSAFTFAILKFPYLVLGIHSGCW